MDKSVGNLWISLGEAATPFEQGGQDRSGSGSVCLLLGEFSSPNPVYSILEVCPFPRLPYYTYIIAPLPGCVNP